MPQCECGKILRVGAKQCRQCYLDAHESTNDMTMAELDALIAERRATMPKEISTRTEYPVMRRTVQGRGRKRKGQEE